MGSDHDRLEGRRGTGESPERCTQDAALTRWEGSPWCLCLRSHFINSKVHFFLNLHLSISSIRCEASYNREHLT